MSGFSFHPELFECRNEALALLSDAGLEWMSDFSSVDVIHDLYGLEVCGIREESSARRVLELLQRRFADWGHGRIYLKDWGGRDPGWKAVVHREPRERGGGREAPR